MSVELAAALSLAEVDPVGGTVAGALEARGFAEGLEQDGAEAVAAVPVKRELALDGGKQMGSQAGEANPGQDEIASVIDDPGQVALAGGAVPADEAVAGGGFPGGGTEAEQGQEDAIAGPEQRCFPFRHPARPAGGRVWLIAGSHHCADRRRPASPVPPWNALPGAAPPALGGNRTDPSPSAPGIG